MLPGWKDTVVYCSRAYMHDSVVGNVPCCCLQTLQATLQEGGVCAGRLTICQHKVELVGSLRDLQQKQELHVMLQVAGRDTNSDCQHGPGMTLMDCCPLDCSAYGAC